MQVSVDVFRINFFNKSKSLLLWICHLSTLQCIHCNSFITFMNCIVFVSAVTQAGEGIFATNVGSTQGVSMELAVSHGNATVNHNGEDFFVM